MGSSKRDLREFPEDVKDVMGLALLVAQYGGKHEVAKVLHGFGSASVLEVVDDHEGDTYRAVYTVRFKEVVYVLHAFQKKSKKGSRTPKPDMDKVRNRLKAAEEDYRTRERK